jgi:hypothetical protein
MSSACTCADSLTTIYSMTGNDESVELLSPHQSSYQILVTTVTGSHPVNHSRRVAVLSREGMLLFRPLNGPLSNYISLLMPARPGEH